MRFTLRGPLGWALAAGVLIAACGGTGGTTNPSAGATTAASNGPRIGSFDRPVVLAFTPSQEAATISTNGAAIKAALEKATGLAWKVTAMSSYAAQVEAMGAGSVDVGFFAPLQMTLLISKSYGTPILGALRKDDTGQLATTYKSQILVRTDSGINSIADLKGKRVAVSTYGSIPHVILKQALSSYGMNPEKDITVLAMGGSGDRLAALTAGAVDATPLDVAYIQRTEQAGFTNLLYLGDVVNLRLGGFAVTTDKIQRNPDQILRVARATLKGVRFLKNNKPDTLAIMRDYLKISGDYVETIYQFSLKSLNENGLVAKSS